MNAFGYMSENAKKMLENAAAEARSFKQNFVGTEHVLLAMLSCDDELSAFFASEGINYDNVRKYVSSKTVSTEAVFSNIISYTAKLKSTLQRCVDKAEFNNHGEIKIGNIMFSMLLDDSCEAVKCITALGGNISRLIESLKTTHYTEAGKDSVPVGGDQPVRSATPMLDHFSKNLCEAALKGELDPVIGREKELERILQILCRRTKNNPVLVGDPGVGKTVIAEGLAQKIVSGDVPDMMKDKIIVSLEMGALLAGTKFRGEFEDRVYKLIKEVRGNGNIILFMDEIHTMIGAGGAEGSVDAANILKPALSKGEIQVIGATTAKEYKKHMEKDSALERRFQPVAVDEPSYDDTVKILRGLVVKYELFHGVTFEDAAIIAAVTLTQRYVADRFLPDKAIDALDEAAARIKIKSGSFAEPCPELETRYNKLIEAKKDAVEKLEFERAAELRDEERSLRIKIDEITELAAQKHKEALRVDAECVAEVVSFWTGIPVARITENEKRKLLRLEDTLHDRVIGQNEAVNAVARAIRRSRAGIADPRRPIGSFLFLGPTGVGKTELCKALAEAMFGDEDAIVRIDMSEYMEQHTVSKLIGSPPGYVGYGEGGQLTERIRRKPYSVVLFDEVEKAHPDVFNIMLQILDDGRLTDSQGRSVNFRNTVIVLTSNAGVSTVKKQNTMGFGLFDTEKDDYEAMKSKIMDEVKKQFRPEFLNRLDEIIAFKRLTEADIRQIAELMLEKTFSRIAKTGITVTATYEAIDMLAKKGYDPIYGARPLRRLIQKTVEDKLSECILAADDVYGKEFVLEYRDSEFVMNDVSLVTIA